MDELVRQIFFVSNLVPYRTAENVIGLGGMVPTTFWYLPVKVCFKSNVSKIINKRFHWVLPIKEW